LSYLKWDYCGPEELANALNSFVADVVAAGKLIAASIASAVAVTTSSTVRIAKTASYAIAVIGFALGSSETSVIVDGWGIGYQAL